MHSLYKEVEVEIDHEDVKFYLDDMSDEDLKRIGYVRTSSKATIEDVKKSFSEFVKEYKPDSYSHHSVLISRIIKDLDL